MLFHEIYNNYFNAVAKVIDLAIEKKLTKKSLEDIVDQYAFEESFLVIPEQMTSDWNLLSPELETPIRHKTTMPLSHLQRQWLKAILLDPRMRLFSSEIEHLDRQLGDVLPLYKPDDFYYFDRFVNGDPYEDDNYVKHFHKVLCALRQKAELDVVYKNRFGNEQKITGLPVCLEYSAKDDHFRLIISEESRWKYRTVNMGRVISCEAGKVWEMKDWEAKAEQIQALRKLQKKFLRFQLVDERNALERVMLHFSDLEKETSLVEDDYYEVVLHYDGSDETEILIRILSFGDVIRVTEPESFVGLIRERLGKQMKLWNGE